MQTWTSTTRIITLQCGKSSSVTDVVLVLPKNRLEIGLLRLTHTEFFGIEPRVDGCEDVLSKGKGENVNESISNH